MDNGSASGIRHTLSLIGVEPGKPHIGPGASLKQDGAKATGLDANVFRQTW